MKVVLTGGGTGGHFYPLIAVAQELNSIIDEDNIANAKLYYISNSPYDQKSLDENRLIFKQVSAGKLHLKPSLKMIPSFFRAGIGVLKALFVMFSIYPDVVFSKGGFAAFPAVLSARILGIPVIIHESDSAPGRMNVWSSKFARAVASSYKQVVDYFPKEKLIHTGQPIRQELRNPTVDGAYEFLELEKDLPIIWILGGSSGAAKINTVIEQALPKLLEKYQVVHQVGSKNKDDMKKLTDATLMNHPFKYRYKMFGFLNALSSKMLAAISNIVITRAGSALFEIAHWRIPAIVIPITNSNGNHQIKNAYNYARSGGCTVIEENNLSDDLLIFEINRIVDNLDVQKAMKKGAAEFDVPGAARKIAREIAGIAIKHES